MLETGQQAEKSWERTLQIAFTALLFLFSPARLSVPHPLKFVFGLYSKLMVLGLEVWMWRVEENHYFLRISSDQSDRILEILGEHGIYHKWFLIADAILSWSKVHLMHVEKSPVTHILQSINFRIGLTIFP